MLWGFEGGWDNFAIFFDRKENCGKKERTTLQMESCVRIRCNSSWCLCLVRSVVESCVFSKKICIFSYGQTGSGKTHTLLGTPNDEGIAFRAIRLIFDLISEEEKRGWCYVVKMTAEELTKDGRRDMVKSSDRSKDGTKSFVTINSTEKAIDFLLRMADLRKTCATSGNTKSSRSHLLCSIHISARNGDIIEKEG